MNIEKISPLSNTVSIYFARPAAGQTEEFLSGHLGPARGTTHTQHNKTIEVYMDRRRNTVRKYAATSAVYGRCIRSTAMSTNVNKVVWWEIKDSQNDVDNN
jgi:hypothetical protein